MKFRTEIELRPGGFRIGYENRLLALGSCFAATMADQLAAAKFRVTVNPTGVLFNPASIAGAVRRFADNAPLSADELQADGNGWFHYDFHGSFRRTDRDEALQAVREGLERGRTALTAADRLIVTFGTARVFEHDGRIVANCHKQPAAAFRERMLTAGEIVAMWSELLAGPLAGREVLFTVSPVRHLAEGLAGNSLSKATLRVAVAELAGRHANAHYFPAYEILTDDLRDYRFYADDLVHPSPAAVAYIRERFAEWAFDAATRRLTERIAAVVAAAAHRPLHPDTEAHRNFCRQQLAEIERLPEVDFQRESDYFRRCLQINS